MSKTRTRVNTDPRLSRRRKAVEKARRRRVYSMVATTAVTAACVWVAFFSPLLAVRDVKITGGKHTTPADVALAADLEGNNLLLLSTADVEADVESLPWVANAHVDRMLPDTVRVKISERRPTLVLESLRGSWTIDRRGRVLTEGRAEEDLPVLSGVATGEISEGERVQHPGVNAALRVWRSLHGGLRGDIVALFAPTPQRISISLEDRTLIRYGGAYSLAAKRRVLKALFERLREQGRSAAYIDVRVPSNPAVAPAGASPSPTPSPETS